MFAIQAGRYAIKPSLLVVDMQNGFVSKGGSYDRLGMNTENYRKIVPKLSKLISISRQVGIPIFYTEAVREPSGIDLLTKVHVMLPQSRKERLSKIPICVRGTWDAQTIDELKPTAEDHIVIKRRDSAFQDTEIGAWLKALQINTLVFTGIDTSICVETSLRDGFNEGYDVILVSDSTASGSEEHYKTTLERVRDYYGVVMSSDRFIDGIRRIHDNKGELPKDRINAFIMEFNLLDPRVGLA
jgi:ureidoacrylate peracid hydrolase